jgi:hypothetical protein
MTDHTARLYAFAAAILVFFVAWAAVAARPWASKTSASTIVDPRVAALAAKEQRVRAEALAVQRVLAARNRAAAATPAAAAVAQPSVRVVTLPPLTITRTS